MRYSPLLYCLFTVFFWSFSATPRSPILHESLAGQPSLRALYLLTPPSDYKALEDVVMSYKNSGADTIIIRPAMTARGIDKVLVTKAVFFAHKAGMKLFVILPTRNSSFLLDSHPDWEDMRYDVKSGRLEPTGKLDLFNPYVTVFLSDFFRDVAGYSVDGILLAEDFDYGDIEGLSDMARSRYKQKYGSAFSLRRALGNIKGDRTEDRQPEEYGEDFWKLAEMKKSMLLVLLKNIMQSARAVNKHLKFGLTLHVPGLFVKEKEVLAWYSHDVEAFKKSDINYFWLAIPHRNLRAEQDINYKKTVEMVSRLAVSSSSLLSDPAKVVFAVQAVDVAGKALPLSEIEDVSTQVKNAGETGIALMIESGSLLPGEFTNKIFKRQAD